MLPSSPHKCRDPRVGVGHAIVLDTWDEVWILNEAVFKHFGAGIKVEAANTDQTSEKNRECK